jgi:molecular chaperone GrpE (heat shock protein)
MTMGEVLKAQSASVRGGLEILLADWDNQHQALLATVEDARKHGFLEFAEIFLRLAKTLESRITQVRHAFSQSDSSALLKIPEALRAPEPGG